MTAVRQIRRWIDTHPQLTLVAVAAVVRIAYLRVAFNTSRAADTPFYLAIARSIADGHLDTDGYPLQGLYSATLSPAYLLDVDVDTWVVMLHLALGVATVVVLYQLARLVVDPTAALVVGGVAAVWPTFVFWTRYIVTETLFLFVLSCFLLVCARQLVIPSTAWTRRLALAASATGVALCRSVGILIVWGALVVLLGASARRRGPTQARRAVVVALVATAFCMSTVLAVPPTRERVLGLSNVSWSIWLSTVKFHADAEHARIAASPFDGFGELPRDEQNEELTNRGLDFIRERPVDYASRVGIRFANFWLPGLTADWSRTHVALDMMLALGLVALAVGAFLLHPAGARRDVLILLVVVIAIQTLVVAFGEMDSDGRYRVPVELPLLVIGGMTFDGVRRRRRAAPVAAEPTASARPDAGQVPVP